MSINLMNFGSILLLITPYAVELSVWIGVICRLCPNYSIIIHMYAASMADI